jgi:hypothetical protein
MPEFHQIESRYCKEQIFATCTFRLPYNILLQGSVNNILLQNIACFWTIFIFIFILISFNLFITVVGKIFTDKNFCDNNHRHD